jgi:hypothetical protein
MGGKLVRMALPGKRLGPPSGLLLRAYHEAGHAVAALVKGFSLTRVTISRRGRFGGACEYEFRIPRAGSRSAVLRLARAGAAVALAGSVAQDAVAAERGWVAVDAATGAPFRPFAPAAEDDARVAMRFARRIHRSPDARRAFLRRMRASTEGLLHRPGVWAAVSGLAHTLLHARTLHGKRVVEAILRALATAGVPGRTTRITSRSGAKALRPSSSASRPRPGSVRGAASRTDGSRRHRAPAGSAARSEVGRSGLDG